MINLRCHVCMSYDLMILVTGRERRALKALMGWLLCIILGCRNLLRPRIFCGNKIHELH